MSAKRSSAGLLTRIIPIIFLAVMVWLVISTVSFAVKIFYSFLAIPLLIMALFFNYSVVTDHISSLMTGLKEDTGKGLLMLIGNVVFYPFVFGYLALKAWTSRTLGTKRKSAKDQRKEKEASKGDYIKYEEVEDDFLELEDIDKPKMKTKVKQTRSKSDTDYDDLFT